MTNNPNPDLQKLAINIVYQIGDELGASPEKRQATNDKFIDLVAKMINRHVDKESTTWGENIADVLYSVLGKDKKGMEFLKKINYILQRQYLNSISNHKKT